MWTTDAEGGDGMLDENVYFALETPKAKTKVWIIRNKGSDAELGRVQWHGPWRRYCYFPTGPAVYSTGCLSDIKDFIDREMTARDSH